MMYVCTAVHNRYEITKLFLKQLERQTYQNFRLIIVDDGGADGTREMVVNKFPDAVVIVGDGNLWWGGSLHEIYKWILKHAQNEDFVFIANDDSKFDDNYLEKAVSLLSKNPNCLYTGCGYSINSKKQIDGVVHYDYKTGEINKSFKENDTGNCASTRSVFLSVKSIKKIGGFHPIMLPHYGSDYEWTNRAYKKGIEIVSSSELIYYFDEKTTGDNNIEQINLKKIFTKRSSLNPFYRYSLIFIITPKKYLPSHLYHQTKRYLDLLIRRVKVE